MRIDVHNHAMPEEALDLLRGENPYEVRIAGRGWRGPDGFEFPITEAFVEVDAKREALRELGIDSAVLSPAPPLFLYGAEAAASEALCDATNEGLRRMAEEGGGMHWVGNLPMSEPGHATAMLERLAAEAGCVGVEVGSAIGPVRLDEPQFEPFWSTAERLRMPVMIHPEIGPERHGALDDYYLQNVIGFPLETTLAIERLFAAGVLQRHPELRILLVHGGGYFPYQAGRLRHARTVRPELAGAPQSPWDCLPQLWFDGLTHDDQALAYLCSRVGIENVVLGTDHPFDMAAPDPVASIESALESDDALRQIAELNPTELFSLDGAA
ncbi:MAG: amidohydrolase [Solirubrobacterales bacterium]|nr:amidohydrolase [Solirubrobacterales bacterium]